MKKLLFASALLCSLAVSANEWSGTVVGVHDGDTVTVLNAQKRQVKIRLVEIDAPESSQAFGTQSQKSLAEMCFQKPVVVNDKGNDKYKRTLGRITCGGVDANLEQVKRGMAWMYRQYSTDQAIAAAEEAAKAGKLGLWADESPMPPWEFRHGGKTKKAAPVAKADDGASSGYQCGGKTKCGQMTDCGEAEFYLKQCGLTRLDRDRDGIPCESICN